MIKKYLIYMTALLLFGCGKPIKPTALDQPPERIIALAPDITESVYALGLGDKLVGATTYCLYPEAAQKVPRVGGFGQFNFEAIVALKPDLVILHWKYESEKTRLQGLGIPYLKIKTFSTSDIIDSIQSIGSSCNANDNAEELISAINNRIAEQQMSAKEIPRVLITFGGDASTIDQIYAFGKASLHNELLELAGGTNVVENNLAFSTLSKEAVIRLNPDIIIQLTPGMKAPENPFNAWKDLSGINAVQHNRIYVLTGDYTCIPGPRFIQTLDDFSEIIRQNNL